MKITWTDCERSESIIKSKEGRKILRTIKRRKYKWIGHILCRKCLLKHVIKGKSEERMEGTGRQE
jgi:hypothetical protein